MSASGVCCLRRCYECEWCMSLVTAGPGHGTNAIDTPSPTKTADPEPGKVDFSNPGQRVIK